MTMFQTMTTPWWRRRWRRRWTVTPRLQTNDQLEPVGLQEFEGSNLFTNQPGAKFDPSSSNICSFRYCYLNLIKQWKWSKQRGPRVPLFRLDQRYNLRNPTLCPGSWYARDRTCIENLRFPCHVETPRVSECPASTAARGIKGPSRSVSTWSVSMLKAATNNYNMSLITYWQLLTHYLSLEKKII